MFAVCFVVLAVVATQANAVVNKERREAPFETYGPPPQRPGPIYGPPPQIPHRQYGVPQQGPFREYGVPALKYGPPKLPFNFGGGSHLNHIGGGIGGGFKAGSSIPDQVKNYFGVPRPVYGPPHQRPIFNGPPPQGKPFTNYGPPPPKPNIAYGPPLPPQQLPHPHPAPLFRPGPRPHGQYGPPPQVHSLQQLPSQSYGPPATNYGVPQTTVIITGSSSGAESQQQHHHQQHQAEIGNIHQIGGGSGIPSLPVQEVQFQIESNGLGHVHGASNIHSHSHAHGSTFPTVSCDGWKPIPAPAGHYVDHNSIQDQTTGYSAGSSAASGGFSTGSLEASNGYSSVSTASNQGYSSANADSNVGYTSTIAAGTGLTDDQLIAVALQSGGFDLGGVNQQVIPLDGPASLPSAAAAPEFHNEQQHVELNSINNAESLQFVQGGSIGDSYSKPPSDSYAPNSIHAEKFNTINVASGSDFGLSATSGEYGTPPSRPSGEYGPPQASPSGEYGPPPPRPHAEYGPPPSVPIKQYGPPPSAPSNQYGPPLPVPSAQYGPPPSAPSHQYGPPLPVPSAQYGPPPSASFLSSNVHQSSSSSSNFESASNIGLQYGAVSGNLRPWNNGPVSLPRHPVAYRPPVPQGLLESIGASVEHLDTFGVKAEGQQQNTYIPPPSSEIAQHINVGGQFQESNSLNSFNEQHIHTQSLPSYQEARFNQQQDCGHGPNLVGGSSQFSGGNFHHHQEQHLTGYNNLAASEEHQLSIIAGPADSYGPPPSGNSFDVVGYASQKQAVVAALPKEAADQLPGLDGLNVISAQKSQSVTIPVNGQKGSYQLQFQSANPAGSLQNGEQANHEQILSEGLLQSILTAIEQPNANANGAQLQKRADHAPTEETSDKSNEKTESASSDEAEEE